MHHKRQELMDSTRKTIKDDAYQGSMKKLRQQIFDMMDELTPQEA